LIGDITRFAEEVMMPMLRVGALAALGLAIGTCSSRTAQDEQSWTQVFTLDPGELSSTGRNPYFVLEPGYQLVLEEGTERLTITVLDATREVNGVETRVVEERETKGGALTEISRNYFAISRRTNSVFYFGEEVDFYENGKVVGHKGAWLAGVDGARFGLMMPGLPLLGARYYQEIAPRVAMDRAHIVSVSEGLKTPAGTFANVLKVEETNPLAGGKREYKLYARGIGMIQDASLTLVRYGMTDVMK
jgi:hypothetical protein